MRRRLVLTMLVAVLTVPLLQTPGLAAQVMPASSVGGYLDSSGEADHYYTIDLLPGDDFWMSGVAYGTLSGNIFLYPPWVEEFADDPYADEGWLTADDEDGYLGFQVPGGCDGTYTLRIHAAAGEGNYELEWGLDQLEYVPMRATQLAGSDRYETALQISANYPSGVEAVVLATGADFPDALCAAPLAGAYGGPILLVPPSGITEALRGELERLAPQHVFIVGGSDVVPSSAEGVAAALSSGPQVTRLAGPTRYETSAAVARQVQQKLGGCEKVVVATGLNFPDALSVAPVAATNGWPILLSTTDTFPYAAQAVVTDLRPDASIVVGGPDVVSPSVMSALPSPTRLEGPSRYETCVAIAEYAVSQGSWFVFNGVATGEDFPDALAAGPYLGALNGVLLLTRPCELPPAIDACASGHYGESLGTYFFGGASVVGPPVWDSVVYDLCGGYIEPWESDGACVAPEPEETPPDSGDSGGGGTGGMPDGFDAYDLGFYLDIPIVSY